MNTASLTLRTVTSRIKALQLALTAEDTRLEQALRLTEPDPHDHRQELRLALLVDGENIGPQHALELLRLAAAFGTLAIRTVYGRNSGWTPAILAEHGLGRPADVPGNGKNAADIHLSLDAKDLLLQDDVSGLVLASCDGDFSVLVRHARKTGKKVYGIGTRHTSLQLKKLYDDFRTLTLAPAPTAAGSPPPKAASRSTDQPLPPAPNPLASIIDPQLKALAENGWTNVNRLEASLIKKDKAFRKKLPPGKTTLHKYLRAHPDDYRFDDGNNHRVKMA